MCRVCRTHSYVYSFRNGLADDQDCHVFTEWRLQDEWRFVLYTHAHLNMYINIHTQTYSIYTHKHTLYTHTNIQYIHTQTYTIYTHKHTLYTHTNIQRCSENMQTVVETYCLRYLAY